MRICKLNVADTVYGAGGPSFGGVGVSSIGVSGPTNFGAAGIGGSIANGAGGVAGSVAGNQISGGGGFQNQVATVAGGVLGTAVGVAVPGLMGAFFGGVVASTVTNTVNAADPDCHPNVNSMGDPEGTGCMKDSSSGGGGGGGGAATGGHGGDASGGGDRGTRGGW